MDTHSLASIAGDVATIRGVLFLLCVLLGALLLLLIYLAYKVTRVVSGLNAENLIDESGLRLFQARADDALGAARNDELLRMSERVLVEHPEHLYAHWYAGLALFRLGRIHESKRHFDHISRVAPDWDDIVEPYIERLTEEASKIRPEIVRE